MAPHQQIIAMLNRSESMPLVKPDGFGIVRVHLDRHIRSGPANRFRHHGRSRPNSATSGVNHKSVHVRNDVLSRKHSEANQLTVMSDKRQIPFSGQVEKELIPCPTEGVDCQKFINDAFGHFGREALVAHRADIYRCGDGVQAQHVVFSTPHLDQ